MPRLFRDSQLMFRSAFHIWLRSPMWLFIGLFQPICYMLLFAPLLKNLAGAPGFPSGGAYNVFTPGLMIMMAIFGAGFAGFGVIERLREGVIERLRVTPVNRLALVLGPLGVDIMMLVAQTALLVAAGIALGFRPDAVGLLLIFAMLLIGGIMMACCSYALALTVKDQSALAASVNLVVLPLLLLSGIMLPLSLAPDILQRIAKANPFSYAVTAARALTDGNLGAASVSQAFIILGVLAALALLWATRSMRKATM